MLQPASVEAMIPTPGSAFAIDGLLPLDSQLISPSLAEAFDIPPVTLPLHDAQQKSAQAQPSIASQMPKQEAEFPYQRNIFSGAQQPIMGPYFPAQTASLPQQPFSLDGQDQQVHGFQRQLQGLANTQQMQPAYGSMSPQFNNWMDASGNVPAQLQGAQAGTKHLHDSNLGSDPENGEDYQARALKRPRLVWTMQLHQRFVDAVEQLGLKNAVPKTIMQLMNVDGLTRENVASHLQKYRLQLRKDGKGDDTEKDYEDEIPKQEH